MSSAAERRQVVDAKTWSLGGFVREGVWKSHCIPEAAQKVHWVLIPLYQCTHAAFLWGVLQMVVYLPWCSVQVVCRELDWRATAAACFWCEGSTQKTICGASLFWVRSCQDIANCDIRVQTHWVCSKQGYFSLPVSLFCPFLVSEPPFYVECLPQKVLSSAHLYCSCKSCAEMEVVQKLTKTRILLMEIGWSYWNEVAEIWSMLLTHLGNNWYPKWRKVTWVNVSSIRAHLCTYGLAFVRALCCGEDSLPRGGNQWYFNKYF